MRIVLAAPRRLQRRNLCNVIISKRGDAGSSCRGRRVGGGGRREASELVAAACELVKMASGCRANFARKQQAIARKLGLPKKLMAEQCALRRRLERRLCAWASR